MAARATHIGVATMYRKLYLHERHLFVKHLLRLDPQSRYIRWSTVKSDQQIIDYADTLKYPWFEIVGFFNHLNELRGCVEIHFDKGFWPHKSELAFTVEKDYQNNKVGTSLLQQALMVSRNRGANKVHINCSRNNIRMIKLAKKTNPVNICYDEDDLIIESKLANASLISIWGEILTDYISMFYSPYSIPLDSRCNIC